MWSQSEKKIMSENEIILKFSNASIIPKFDFIFLLLQAAAKKKKNKKKKKAGSAVESAEGDEDRIVDAHPAPLADKMTDEVAALKDSDEVDEEEGSATGTG